MTAGPLDHSDAPVPPGLRQGPILLDYNATTPVDPRVVEAMLPYLTTHFGNPSSGHPYADQPRTALGRARAQVAALIGAEPADVVFTGSGSEADALAIAGVVLAHPDPGRAEVITQPTEHPAVLEICHALHRRHGTQITHLPVDAHGLVDPGDLAAAISPRTVLVSIMAANNETGVLQPLDQLARITRTHGVPLHTDAAQAAGKIPLDVTGLGVDLLSLAGHKLYAPKGIGALYLRPGLRLEPLVPGGGQERGLRAGTENVALAVALGTAAELAAQEITDGGPGRLRHLRDRLHQRLAERLPGRVHLNGHPERRLPGTLNLGITGARGTDLVAAVPGVAASTGSACHSGVVQPSPVLAAMYEGRHDRTDRATSALRLSLGRWTTAADVDRAAELLATAARTHATGTAAPRSPGS
ncbi:cysteine desulfurase family protein [Actinomadura kijaniata]|uniref:cysteine desulfurase family protein n=1 Tax=Actinomadura kijaniata TaxID=46161 RepID=UPI00082E6597|nr:cysteine desulfurase family protein [Actinomadura kijaniata]